MVARRSVDAKLIICGAWRLFHMDQRSCNVRVSSP
jgi:hypothetical protein